MDTEMAEYQVEIKKKAVRFEIAAKVVRTAWDIASAEGSLPKECEDAFRNLTLLMLAQMEIKNTETADNHIKACARKAAAAVIEGLRLDMRT